MTQNMWPLMQNNITRSDLNKLIDYLKQPDPQLTNGPQVRKFEEEWSSWLGVKYSIMVNSGSSANDLTMMALKELRGEGEVIVPPLTWVSDISAVIRAGLKPVFVDVNPKTFALDSKKVLDAITPQTRGVFLTHVLGFNGLTDELIGGLKNKQIPLIEDVCESHGVIHKNKKAGAHGWASNFSFYYAHHMTTIEGGMISTNDESLYDMIRIMRSHGMIRESLNEKTKQTYLNNYPDLNPDFIFAFPSHNMRSTEINAILGLEQLPRLDQNNLKRTRNLELFLSLLNSEIFQTDFDLDGSSNYALTLVLKYPDFKKRDKVEHTLKAAGIEFRRGLSGGGNQLRQPYLKRMADLPKPESMKVTDHIHHFAWYIGNYPTLEVSKIRHLGKILREI